MSQDSRLFRRLKLAGLIFFIAVIIALSFSIDEEDILDRDSLQETAQDNLVFASFIFIGIFVLLKLLFTPISPIAIVGGYIFGPGLGFALSFSALMISSIIPFLAAKHLGRKSMEGLIEENYPRLHRYDSSMKKHGYLSVFLLRVIPTAPLSAVNIFIGLTSIRLKHFIVGSVLGFLPTTFLLSFIGDRLADPSDPLLYVLGALYIAVIAIPIIYQKKKGAFS